MAGDPGSTETMGDSSATASSSGPPSASSAPESSGPGSSETSSTGAGDTTGLASSSGAAEQGDDDGPSCVLHHHEVGSLGQCNTDASCCPGSKCVPSPEYSECVPVDVMPADIGEPCTRTGVLDDCVAGAVCRGTDPRTSEGRCVELCRFGHECDEASVSCVGSECLAPCDPLDGTACPPSDVCLPFANAELFACVPDDLPATPGQAGDPCSPYEAAYAGCDPDHLCVPDELVAIDSCAGDAADGCCTPICPVLDESACAGLGAGICEPVSTLLQETWPDELGAGYCR
ncbi:MAG: hypothetical protein IAG13_23070 [Deltaproteobacteria bacterium]|nr:hypothetical protein [Nannocystaceae bacterium]